LSYTDPYVSCLKHGGINLCTVSEDKAADSVDCAVICTNHKAFDYPSIAKRFPLVLDTRNALKGIQADNVFRL
jgi:UDP-N-acetyl-D-glucosamine dehydrogenase